MPNDRFPAPDLSLIFDGQSPAHIVSTIPLEPASRVMIFVYPTFFLPYFERLTGVFMKKIYFIVVMLGRKLGARKPTFGELFFAISHVLTTKDSEREHLFRCKPRLEFWMKITTNRLDKFIFITLLKFIVYLDCLFFHRLFLSAIYIKNV